jgi:hypothetical protein
VGVFGVPIVESENDVAILLGFREVDFRLVWDKEIGETGVIGDAFVEEAFRVCSATVGLVFCENEDTG